MKVIVAAVAISTLGSAVSGFTNNALPSSTKKAFFSPLSMLPTKKSMASSTSTSTTSTSKDFFPFEESSSPVIMQAGPNKEAEDGSAGVRQLLGLKGASEETDIWKIRLQLTKVRSLFAVLCDAV